MDKGFRVSGGDRHQRGTAIMIEQMAVDCNRSRLFFCGGCLNFEQMAVDCNRSRLRVFFCGAA